MLPVLLLVCPIPFPALGAAAKLTAFFPTQDAQTFSPQSMIPVVVCYISTWLRLPFAETGKVKALVCSERILLLPASFPHAQH